MLNVAERRSPPPPAAAKPSPWDPGMLDRQVGACPASDGPRVWRLLPHWNSLLRTLSLQGPLSWQAGQGDTWLGYGGSLSHSPASASDSGAVLQGNTARLDAATTAWGWAFMVQTPETSGHRRHRLAIYDHAGQALLEVHWPLQADPERLARLLARWGDPCLRPRFREPCRRPTAQQPQPQEADARLLEDTSLADVLHAAHLQGLPLSVCSASDAALLNVTGVWHPPAAARGQRCARTACGRGHLTWQEDALADMVLRTRTAPSGVRSWLECMDRQRQVHLTIHPIDTAAERCRWRRLIADLNA